MSAGSLNRPSIYGALLQTLLARVGLARGLRSQDSAPLSDWAICYGPNTESHCEGGERTGYLL
jgi:hypothetical protein